MTPWVLRLRNDRDVSEHQITFVSQQNQATGHIWDLGIAYGAMQYALSYGRYELMSWFCRSDFFFWRKYTFHTEHIFRQFWYEMLQQICRDVFFNRYAFHTKYMKIYGQLEIGRFGMAPKQLLPMKDITM